MYGGLGGVGDEVGGFGRHGIGPAGLQPAFVRRSRLAPAQATRASSSPLARGVCGQGPGRGRPRDAKAPEMAGDTIETTFGAATVVRTVRT